MVLFTHACFISTALRSARNVMRSLKRGEPLARGMAIGGSNLFGRATFLNIWRIKDELAQLNKNKS